MRPDKQKQKYKKRAGYGPNKETTKDETKPRNKDRTQKTGDDKDTRQKKDEASTSAVAKEAPRPDSGQSDDEMPRDQPRPQFRRRVVESNWNRYEEPPPDEEVVDEHEQVHDVKVTEFQQLLSARIASGAHLILEDERDWSTEGGNDVTGLNDDVTAGLEYLSIDCDSLVEVMKCIPLHELLGVEEVARQANLVEYFNEQAGESRTRSKPDSSKFCFRSPSKTGSKEEFAPLAESLARTLNHSAAKTETTSATSAAKSDEKCSVNDAENNDGQPEVEFSWDASEVVTLDWDNVPEEATEEVEQSETAEVPEHELSRTGKVPEYELSKTGKAPEALEVTSTNDEDDELESLLSLSVPMRESGPHGVKSDKSAMAATSVVGTTAETEDLEDWLNTIL